MDTSSFHRDDKVLILGKITDESEAVDMESQSNTPECSKVPGIGKKKHRPEAIPMTQAVILGARVGGVATLTGHGTNLLVMEFLDR